jgi:NAD(P)-dependent dehydrogenase (short-subunit alcohol dehydrogenase family)
VEDLTKHIVITGASSGIGAAAAREMARRGWRVTLTGRDQARLDKVLEGVPGGRGLIADFADLKQVRRLAEELQGEQIDVLANNAGLITRGTTVDGFDATMQINHISPFLLTTLLRPQLPDGGRIITTASMASATGANPVPPDRKFPSVWLAYGTSKKANTYFAAEAARRWPELLSFSFHPGVVKTNFGTPVAKFVYRIAPGIITPEQGAEQLVWLATAPAGDLVNGAYYVRHQVAGPSAKSEAVASQLWDATASLVTH